MLCGESLLFVGFSLLLFDDFSGDLISFSELIIHFSLLLDCIHAGALEVVIPMSIVLSSLIIVTLLGEEGSLLFNSLVHELDILELLLSLLLILGSILHLGEHSHIPVPVDGGVIDFSLEGDALEIRDVEIDSLEFLIVLELILEGDVSGDSRISDEPLEIGLVLGEDDVSLVSELEDLVNLDLKLHLEPDDLVLQDGGEVLPDFIWSDSRDCSLGLLDEFAQSVELTTLSLDRDHIDNDTVLLGDIADLFVEGVTLLVILVL